MQLLAALIVIALVQGFLVKLYQVPSESMEPTLHVDGINSDRFLVNRLAYQSDGPRAGDVVVFNRPDSWGENTAQGALRTAAGALGDLVGIGPSNQNPLVKRVLAVGGDTLSCCSADGSMLLNGEPLNEPYVADGNNLPFDTGTLDCTSTHISSRCFGAITVPEGEVLVLGDNRANSSDSVVGCRGLLDSGGGCARFVPESTIVGEVVTIVYPFSRWSQSLSQDPTS